MDAPEGLTAGTLVVDRTSDRDIGMRDLYVRVDELEEITLLYGEGVQVRLLPGSHQIKVTNRLYTRRAEFELLEGEHVRFEVANVPGSILFAPLLIMGGTGVYKVAIQRTDPQRR
ncbi:MAG: hypothetical protein M9921_04290 [Fimbriimonadaceae bacterium]|nr:hypothetical protein [Chthonomonadaceae bacterium]MCO5296055.1 hypothetical protein [Fimbriimonadaceae bacterium]